jgi:hypothetical protein
VAGIGLSYAGGMQITWKPLHNHAERARGALPDSAFAFPKERKEPLTDAAHVRSAIARFGEVRDVSESERGQAFANIKAAASYYGVSMRAGTWHDLIG